jgi:hypothetical protein
LNLKSFASYHRFLWITLLIHAPRVAGSPRRATAASECLQKVHSRILSKINDLRALRFSEQAGHTGCGFDAPQHGFCA